ncbi:Carboxypeptidase A5 [Durusdinium trenchii]|uniref:Carboxypeptidase A5 n=1 Tax=Durusdinium trenchii TaxID=1381693 RepID=A0ABP0SPN2_9DINO
MAFATPFSGSLDQKPEDRAFLSTIVTQCPANALVLDVGSGPQAQAARFLASPRRRVCCVDIDAAALRSAAMLLGPLADGVQADMSDLGRIFRSEMFDLVVGFYSLQHHSDPVALVRSMVPSSRRCLAFSVLLDCAEDGRWSSEELWPFDDFKSLQSSLHWIPKLLVQDHVRRLPAVEGYAEGLMGGRFIHGLERQLRSGSDFGEASLIVLSVAVWAAGGSENGEASERCPEPPNRPHLPEDGVDNDDSEFLLVLNGNPRSRQKVEEGDFCLRTNPAGVDLNRNWDEEWQQESAGFGKDSNPGPAPFSEPETRIFRRLVSEYQPTTYLSVHSGTLGLYMPWAFDETHLADRNQKAMMDLLQELDEAHCHCPYGAAGKEVGYSCPGTSLDWIYDKLKTPYSFAFEIFVGNDLAQKLKDRWEDEKSHSAALLQQGHLAHAVNFFQEHPSDFVQLSSADVSLSRDCFAIYNPSSEELFHSTVKNWVSVYLEMAQKIAKNLQKDKTGEGA